MPQRIAVPSLPAFVGGLVSFLAVTSLSAQQPALTGRVQDDRGGAIAGVEVTLHRVTALGGTSLAVDTTDTDGRFRLGVGAAAADTALFFAAARVDGALYVGEPFRGPIPGDVEYMLVVGAAAAAPPAAMTTNASGSTAAATLALLAILFAAGWLVYGRRRARIRPARRALIAAAALAEYEDAHVGH